MSVNVIEIDDVIPKLYQDQVEAETSSGRTPWSFHAESGRRVPEVEMSYSGFSHLAYHINDDAAAQSAMTALLLPVLFMYCDKAGLRLNTLLRIRLGLFPR